MLMFYVERERERERGNKNFINVKLFILYYVIFFSSDLRITYILLMSEKYEPINDSILFENLINISIVL